MSQACEDDNSKLVDVVTVADFDKERVGNILAEFLTLFRLSKLRFGQIAQPLLVRL